MYSTFCTLSDISYIETLKKVSKRIYRCLIAKSWGLGPEAQLCTDETVQLKLKVILNKIGKV